MDIMGHPRELAESYASHFFTHLAVKARVATSTENQALATMLFLYNKVLEKVLKQPSDVIKGVARAFRPKRLPAVLTADEVAWVMPHLKSDSWLIATLFYGGGLRLLEARRLRVKYLNFERGEITVREGKGDKDRVTMLSQVATSPLKDQFEHVTQMGKIGLLIERNES
jgi:integrase